MPCLYKLKSTSFKESSDTGIYTYQQNTDISWRFAEDIDVLAKDWQLATKDCEDTFLQVPFLRALQCCPPQDVEIYYIIFYYKNELAGVTLFQSKLFEASKSIKEEKGDGLWRGIVRNVISKRINFLALLNGNALLTGEHGFYFDYNIVDKKLVPEYISLASKFLKEKILKERKHSIIHIVKDLYVDEKLNKDWKDDNYNKIIVQPNMLLKLRKEWSSFEDYTASMSSKYRKNLKRGLKKGKELKKFELSEEQIEKFKPKLFELYRNVKDNANFNLFELNENYFQSLKKELGSKFRIIAFFKNEEIVGFYTLIHNHKILDAHFLGYDKSINHECQLYFNMLLDMVKEGIENKYEEVEFARTAMEIKSSVGAEPREMCIYIKHENNMLNKAVGSVTNLMNPKIDWKQRHPFK